MCLPFESGGYSGTELTALTALGYLILVMPVISAVTSDVRLIAGFYGPVLVLPYSSSAYDSGQITAIKAGGYAVVTMTDVRVPSLTGTNTTSDVKLILGLA